MNEYEKIGSLDLSDIKMKLMHKSGEGWSQVHADAVELEYRRFLYLAKKYPDQQTAPTVDVDTFWHSHILDTRKYARDCQEIFGYFLHHFPYLGIGARADEAAREQGAELMRKLYEQTFGQSYVRGSATERAKPAAMMAAYCTYAGGLSAAQHAYCALTTESADHSDAAYCTLTTESAGRCDAAYCTLTTESADRSRAAPAAYCALAVESAGRSYAAPSAYCTSTAYCTVTAKSAGHAATTDGNTSREQTARMRGSAALQ
jgi:hypothetical protein